MTKEIIQILKSGDFTLLYHDNGYCSLYHGRFSYDDLKEDAEIASFDMDDRSIGYAPEIVCLLIKALGGEVDSI